MKWKDLSLKERKQIYDSVRVNNPDATYFDNSPSNWFRNGKDRRCKDCKKQQYLKRKRKKIMILNFLKY